jgi:hypothetical protein
MLIFYVHFFIATALPTNRELSAQRVEATCPNSGQLLSNGDTIQTLFA